MATMSLQFASTSRGYAISEFLDAVERGDRFFIDESMRALGYADGEWAHEYLAALKRGYKPEIDALLIRVSVIP